MEKGIKATGRVKFTLRRADGTVETWGQDNLVVNIGLAHIAQLLHGDPAPDPMTHMALGDGDQAGGATAPSLVDTALQHEIPTTGRKSFTSVAFNGATHQVTYQGDWGTNEVVAVLTEAGIFDSPSAGNMMARTTFAAKNKEANDSITVEWIITIA